VAVETKAAPGTNYRTIYSEDDLRSLAKRLTAAGVFAFDTETSDIAAMRAQLVGISVCPAPGESYYVPVGHRRELGDREQLPLATVLTHLGPVFEDPSLAKIAHNGKYDMIMLANQGVWVRNLVCDTMVAAYVLGEGGDAEGFRSSGGSLGLKRLAAERLGIQMTEITEILGKRGPKQLSMPQVPAEAAGDYACADADMTLRLRDVLERGLKEQNLWRLFTEVEMPLVPVLTRMEMAGVALDVVALRDMSRQLGEQVVRLEEDIYTEAGHSFNIG